MKKTKNELLLMGINISIGLLTMLGTVITTRVMKDEIKKEIQEEMSSVEQ